MGASKKSSHWNYRIFKEVSKSPTGKEEDFFTIREVHYKDDKPYAYASAKDSYPSGENLKELFSVLDKMSDALRRTILTEEDFE